MAEFPRKGLWVVRVEIREKLRIGEMDQARAIVCHRIQVSGEMLDGGRVSKMPPMQRQQPQQVCCTIIAGDRALESPFDCRGVVAVGRNCSVSDIPLLRNNILLRYNSGEF